MTIYAFEDVRPVLPEIGRYWIAPDANVIGKVRLGEETGIWFGATLRGDNEWITIGARSNVQECCIFHTDMGFPLEIGPDCTIGHAAIVHGATVGANSLIGMGAVILNGARIGANSVVGASALVTEGKSFPDNSLIVGSPARAVRSLDADAVARITESAAHYVTKARRFAKGLARLEG